MNISAELSQQLKAAGLTWRPALHDFFSVPDTDIADRVFVLADMMAGMEVLQGHHAITFNGATEWALDYVFVQEVLWRPTETQVRIRLQQQLGEGAKMMLGLTPEQYVCQIQIAEEPLNFYAPTAPDAYGQALLFLLQKGSGD